MTTGNYSVHLPDGRIQTVIYRADTGGYRANVTYQNDAERNISQKSGSHNSDKKSDIKSIEYGQKMQNYTLRSNNSIYSVNDRIPGTQDPSDISEDELMSETSKVNLTILMSDINKKDFPAEIPVYHKTNEITSVPTSVDEDHQSVIQRINSESMLSQNRPAYVDMNILTTTSRSVRSTFAPSRNYYGKNKKISSPYASIPASDVPKANSHSLPDSIMRQYYPNYKSKAPSPHSIFVPTVPPPISHPVPTVPPPISHPIGRLNNRNSSKAHGRWPPLDILPARHEVLPDSDASTHRGYQPSPNTYIPSAEVESGHSNLLSSDNSIEFESHETAETILAFKKKPLDPIISNNNIADLEAGKSSILNHQIKNSPNLTQSSINIVPITLNTIDSNRLEDVNSSERKDLTRFGNITKTKYLKTRYPYLFDPDSSVFQNNPSIIIDHQHPRTRNKKPSLAAPYVLVAGAYSFNPHAKYIINHIN